jgi:hypothetical protein
MFIENLASLNEAGAFACEAFRVLRPGGVLALYSPDYPSWGSFFFDEHYTHNFVTSGPRLAHLLACQRFDVSETVHCLGWLDVRGGFWRSVRRNAVWAAMWPLSLPPVRGLCAALGLGRLVWKLRKTFFVGVLVIGRRPRDR